MNFRIEKDTMGEVQVPADAIYGAQTQRSIENFRLRRTSIKCRRRSSGHLLILRKRRRSPITKPVCCLLKSAT
jgi:fumarate hydratase class II